MQFKKLFFLLPVFAGIAVFAQDLDDTGFEIGNFKIDPLTSGSVVYDNRVLESGTKADSDVYSAFEVGVKIKNLPARYDLTAFGLYGYRIYNEYSGLNDDYYKLDAAVGTSANNLKWKLGSGLSKTLNYNTEYNSNAGVPLDSILVNEPSQRFQASGAVSYSVPFSERISIDPSYGIWYYHQELLTTGETEEWQEHAVTLPFKYNYSDKTQLSLGGVLKHQGSEQEDGVIGTSYIGIESRVTGKTSYSVKLGISGADYDVSGTDVGGVSNCRLTWEPTIKIKTFVFGGNQFQPGYGGEGARMVYRVGYGAMWNPYIRWTLGLNALHDYEQAVSGDDDEYGDDRHFFTGRLGYRFVRRGKVSFISKYIIDEVDVDQVVVSLRLDLAL